MTNLNTQPANHLTIRDHATRTIITTLPYGSRAVMFAAESGVPATLDYLTWIGLPASRETMDLIAAAGATSLDIADEYVY